MAHLVLGDRAVGAVAELEDASAYQGLLGHLALIEHFSCRIL